MTRALVVANGDVATSHGTRRADVRIADGVIEAIGSDLAQPGDEILDASARLVLPGVIDVHTHVRLPSPEQPDRFRRDMVAAAAGGTTTVLTFNNPGTGISADGARSLLAGLDEFVERTAGESPIDFGLNAVVTGTTVLPPLRLLRELQAIESDLGRERPFPNAARTIDLDLLFYDALILDMPDLILPHPRLHERHFVLVPLAELAPDLRHPRFARTIQELLFMLEPVTGVQPRCSRQSGQK